MPKHRCLVFPAAPLLALALALAPSAATADSYTYTTINEPLGTTTATGINNSGQVVGCYQDSSGNVYGFVATPARVPEPSTIVLLGMAVPVVGC